MSIQLSVGPEQQPQAVDVSRTTLLQGQELLERLSSQPLIQIKVCRSSRYGILMRGIISGFLFSKRDHMIAPTELAQSMCGPSRGQCRQNLTAGILATAKQLRQIFFRVRVATL
jgi:hypothetical protein